MARWDTVRLPDAASPALYDVLVLSDDVVLAVGHGPSMLRTADGGASWASVGHEVTSPCLFRGVARAGPTALVVVTDLPGLVLRSDDDGATWTRVEAPSTALSGVWSDGDGLVVAVGEGGCVVRSTSGGLRWERAAAPAGDAGGSLYAVAGSANTLVAVGAGGLALRSDDGGATWRPAASLCGSRAAPAAGTSRSLHGVWGVGPTFFACGEDGALLRSDDGGATFRELVDAKGRSWARWGDDAVSLAAIGGRSERDVVAVGGCGTVLRTRDGGARWTRDETGSFGFHNGLHVPAKGRAYAVGDGGVIVRSAR